MIVWLASYPRSGNTLLRQIFRHCFGRPSYSADHLAEGVFSDEEKAQVGHADYLGTWEAFYDDATHSPDVVLVKTHGRPADAQKALYVVRDGRLAVQSFHAYNHSYEADPPSLMALLFGDHVFGSWSGHYAAWASRPAGQTMVLRFEDLVDCSEDLLRRIAEFVGHRGPVRSWENPHRRLQQLNPTFFRQGEKVFQARAPWTPLSLRLFFALHGPLMAELGYAHETSTDELSEWIEHTRSLLGKAETLQKVCDERLAVIQCLDRACAERLEVIARLQRECEARLAQIRCLHDGATPHDRELAG